MTTISPQMEKNLRRGFKHFNRFMLLFWRLGLGGWVNALPETGGQIMVLTHTGRKSGLVRRTPVNYAVIDGDIYCAAGFGRVTDWYNNVLAHPEVEVWLPDSRYTGRAEDVTGEGGCLDKMREVLIASGFAAYLAGFNPKKMSDAELEQATQGYRLIKITRTAPLTGPGGPGDLGWVWPLATLVLLPLVLFRWNSTRNRVF